METMDTILNRRSIRRYLDQDIPEEVLNMILVAGASAPSGLNLQPWYIAALKSSQAKQALLEVMADVAMGIGPELESRFAGKDALIQATKHFIGTLGNAPVILLVFLLRDDYADQKTALLSVAAAVENILIAAQDQGLGSCWLTAPDQTGHGPALRDRFAPGKGDLAAVVTLGYPNEQPKPVARREGRSIIL